MVAKMVRAQLISVLLAIIASILVPLRILFTMGQFSHLTREYLVFSEGAP